MRLIQIQGCRRSGNHAVIEWIFSYYKGGCLHNNLPLPWNGKTRPSEYLMYGDYERFPEIEIQSWEDKVLKDAVIVLRSAYNCVASRLNGPKYLLESTRKICRFTPVWKAHAKMVLAGHPHIVYDHWLNNPKPAHQLLQLPTPCKRRTARKPRRGSGSSFKHSPSNYFERWKQVDLPTEIVEDKEIAELNKEIFGWWIAYN